MNFLKKYEEMGEIVNVQETTHKKALRINTLKTTEKKLIQTLKNKKVKLEKIPYLKNGYFYESEYSLASTPEYLQGHFYLQDAASQIPPELLDPKPNETILDMAASPGGKCSHLAQLMNNQGIIIALEENKSRIHALQNNLERLSITNTTIIKKDARFSHDYKIKFDKILLDAPCGGNYCVEENYFKTRTEQDLQSKSRTQKELLKSAYKSLKNKGTLIYSTCSLEPEENELVIHAFLEEHEDMQLEEINIKIGERGITKYNNQELNPELRKTKRLWPHKTHTDGFFIAKLTKK